MPDLTFIIPSSVEHKSLLDKAISSVVEQTVPCAYLSRIDLERKGPGFLRNRMLEEVTTEFVTFLDADDTVHPEFAQRTIAEYRRIGGKKYVYTDWIDFRGRTVGAPCKNGPNDEVISMPDSQPYCGGTWHTITTLLPTAWAKIGFDESLPAVEDTDFYLKLCISLRCGHHLAQPLFYYSGSGGRGAAFHHGPDYQRVMNLLTIRYGGHMGCCGATVVTPPIGQRQPGDVMAMALWRGNRTELGRITGRIYPRMSSPRVTWVDPKDVGKSPHLWQKLDTVDDSQGLQGLQQIANVAMSSVVYKTQNDVGNSQTNRPPMPVTVTPDVSRVLRLAGVATNTAPTTIPSQEDPFFDLEDISQNTPIVKPTGLQQAIDQHLDKYRHMTAIKSQPDPIFVFPAKRYPSYEDIEKLIDLSGFQRTTVGNIQSNTGNTYIVLSPEPIVGEWSGNRVIAWQLEYAGEYINNCIDFNGEVWASDRAWALANGAKYVLMGSHPDLASPAAPKRLEYNYDVTMLGYMVGRRQTVKNWLSQLRWPIDYPGHDTVQRDNILWSTNVMLHVHQHENAPYTAPQRFAIAAAYHMPMISEMLADLSEFRQYVMMADYRYIPNAVIATMQDKQSGEALHNYLCKERTFRTCILEAIRD